MKIAMTLAGVALAVAVSSAVLAQSSDAAYCGKLSDAYDKYVQTTGSRGSKQPPLVNVTEAQARCKTDPASAIPVLEQTLKDNKLPLPSRG